jgi:hypothetical protein
LAHKHTFYTVTVRLFDKVFERRASTVVTKRCNCGWTYTAQYDENDRLEAERYAPPVSRT